MAAGAFAYLTWTSVRNRFAHRVRQSRNPRYLLAVIVGLGYFYLVFWRNPRYAGHDQAFPLLNDSGWLFALAGLVLGAWSMWIFGGDSTALAFTPAEASFLFPAPVSRRQLVLYKLLRGQLPLLFNTLIWVLLLDTGASGIPAWARGIGLWLLFSAIFLHRLGASLVRTAWAEHGLQGVRRNALSLGVFAIVVAGVAMTLMRHAEGVRQAADLDARLAVVAAAVGQAPARYVLWPFTALLGPVFAGSLWEWTLALPASAIVVLVHVWWVLHTDTAFEEAALAATEERARRLETLRGKRAAGGAARTLAGAVRISRRAGRSTGVPLAPTGHPAVAILWKNLACLRRTSQQRQLVTPLLLALMIGFVTGGRLGAYAGIATAFLAFALAMLLLGPVMLRGDLRQDLQHLAELKTLPLRGATIVAAEVLSVSIPLALLQALALALAAAIAGAGGVAWAPYTLRLAVFVGLPPVLLAFNACSVTIQNGAPILFPGWSRLGAVVPGGVEMMGQTIVMMGFYLILLMVLLLLPVGAGILAVMGMGLTGPAGVAGAMIVGSGALALELLGVVQMLGRAFERLEPAATSG